MSLRSCGLHYVKGWEADERPEPRSLGLLPSGPDPVGEWLVHRQPPGCYIGRGGAESKPARPPPWQLCRARYQVREAEMSETGWSLHPQLHADTVPVGDLTLSRLLAMNDADFPWLLLVPRRVGASEIIDLGAEQSMLMNEVSLVSRALKDETRCDKLNVAAIGNVVAQLHIHIIARRKDDPLWPKPVWGAAAQRSYDAPELARFVGAIRDRIGLHGGSKNDELRRRHLTRANFLSGLTPVRARHRSHKATRPGTRSCRRRSGCVARISRRV